MLTLFSNKGTLPKAISTDMMKKIEKGCRSAVAAQAFQACI